jgi:ClpP class serine protease
LSDEAIQAGNIFDSLAQRNNLEFRQAVMKGTGQVSDFETKLTERASGLDKDNSVEANRFFATVAAENYRTIDKLGVEWQKYQKANPSAKFAQFEQSDVYKSAQAERENRLKKYFPEIERGDLGFGQRAPSKGMDDAEMESFRKRYGTQKGNQ